MSTLSVEISTNASSAPTLSPTFFNQRVMVPSVTDSPSCGKTTSTTAPLVGAEAGGAGGVGAGAATGSGVATGAGGSSTFGAGGVAVVVGVGAPADSLITPSCPPTGTTASTCAEISVSTPLIGEGISVSTLSVEISTNGSSTWTVSPTFFNHRVTVPSVTDSPNWGSTTDCDIFIPFLYLIVNV